MRVLGTRYVLIRGHVRMPFKGRDYTGARVLSGRERAALEPELRRRLALAEARRGPLTGPRLAARIAGILSALRRGVVGDSHWGHAMAGRKGGNAQRRHLYDSARAQLARRRRAYLSRHVPPV